LNRPWYITAALALGIFCGYSFVALERDAGALEQLTAEHEALEDNTSTPIEGLSECPFCQEKVRLYKD
jgi:hypothetical protein